MEAGTLPLDTVSLPEGSQTCFNTTEQQGGSNPGVGGGTHRRRATFDHC